MQDFSFRNPTKIVFGKSSMDKIVSELTAITPLVKKVLVTYGQGSIKKNGIYDKVMKELNGFTVEEFDGIEPNPRVETLRKAITIAKEFQPDIILAVGGGSVIDGSKLIAAATHYSGDAWDFLLDWNLEPQKYIPLATVLTMSATCSEMNSGAVITNWTEYQKLFFERPQLYPVFSILDPQNTYTLPKEQIAASVVDPFVHVIEQYINTSLQTPLQDRWAEGLLMTLIENGPKAMDNPKDYDSRANLMLAGSMALNGLIVMGAGQDWATHNIEHEISAFYDITHAAGLAVILPRWMEVVAMTQKLPKLVQYGKRIWSLEGSDADVAKVAIDKTYEFFASLGCKMSLADFSINDEHFDTMVERLAKSGIGEIKLTAEQIRSILDKSL